MSETKQRFLDGLHTIKTLTGVSQSDFDTLKEAAPEATQWVDSVVQFFYDTIFAHARTAAVFHDGERPAREKTLQDWYLALFSFLFSAEASSVFSFFLKREEKPSLSLSFCSFLSVLFRDSCPYAWPENATNAKMINKAEIRMVLIFLIRAKRIKTGFIEKGHKGMPRPF